ncbi:MAG: hypothetical protein Q4D62_14730 [Planctomycetia bacterium]|nr:hypothetical protein [Planctomycetia bacterium]
MKSCSRRQFLKTTAVAGSVPLWMGSPGEEKEARGETVEAPKKTRWYKGQLHTHSQWSDGSSLPECVCAAYRERGYDFLCLSDHNVFANKELRFTGFGVSKEPEDKTAFEGADSFWKPIVSKGGWAQLTQKFVDEAREKFGDDTVQTKTVGETTYVRMKRFDELQKQWDEPEKFLLIPGFEQTGGCKTGLQVHMNFINVTDFFPYCRKETAVETVHENAVVGEDFYQNNPEPYLFILNHPQWPYYDVSPEVLRRLEKVRFFELTNNPVTGGPFHEKGWNPEKYWDVVNAYRAANRQPLLYATGSDDAHSIDENNHLLGPFWGWNMVRAEKLSTSAIMNAMLQGDFYVSTGITLQDVQFSKETRTLSVRVQEENPENVKIEFIGTKKTFTREFETIETEKPIRNLEVYAENIGVVLKTATGLESSYTLQDDDLYVRARITWNDSAESRKHYQVLTPAAWTQAWGG